MRTHAHTHTHTHTHTLIIIIIIHVTNQKIKFYPVIMLLVGFDKTKLGTNLPKVCTFWLRYGFSWVLLGFGILLSKTIINRLIFTKI